MQACYFEKNWGVGKRWFSTLLQFSENKEQSTLAAAALVEAFVAERKFDDIENLLPYLDTQTKARLQPRLNLEFLQAGDRLVELEDNAKASLFYYLTMTPRHISVSYEKLLEDLQPKLDYYRKKKEKYGKHFSKKDQKALSSAEFEWKSLNRKKERVDGWMKDPNSNYAKDLLWRRAQNYRAMGRDWKAYWGFTGLLQDYPDVDTDLKEKIYYNSIIQALKIGKKEEAMRLAEESHGSPEYQQFAGPIGLLLANIYRDEAKELFQKSETADTLPEMEALRNQAGKSYDKMWAICQKMLEKKLSTQDADLVISMMGAVWIKRGQDEPEKWEELTKAFEQLLANNSEADAKDSNHGLHYWLGMTYLYQSHYKIAHQHFESLVQAFPQSTYFEDALFRRGVCAKGMEDFKTAQSNFKEFTQRFPDSRLVVEAEVFRGDMARDQDQLEDAVESYQNVLFQITYD